MIVKQGEIRANIKKYFDLAYDGEYIVVPRKENKNVVILSEDQFERMQQKARLQMYAEKVSGTIPSDMEESLKGKPPVSTINSYLETTDILTDNRQRLQAFRLFEDGWNGYGAEAFLPELIDKVTMIIEQQNIQPEIFPTALGTIQLEYDNSRGDHMEIEIGMKEKAEVFTVLKTGQTYTEEIDADADVIKERVGAFYG